MADKMADKMAAIKAAKTRPRDNILRWEHAYLFSRNLEDYKTES